MYIVLLCYCFSPALPCYNQSRHQRHECECFTRVSKHEKTVVFECLETSVKHEARVYEMASQSAPNYKQRILFSLTFSFYFLLLN